MQKYLKYLISILIFISLTIAQVTEGMVEFNLGEHNALQLTFTNTDKKLVEDEWKKYTKSFGATDKKKGEFITKGVVLEGLTNPVDLFLCLDKKKQNILFQLCVISNEEFLSSTNQINNYKVVENFLEDFVFVIEKAKVKEKFESEKKELANLQKDLKKLSGKYEDNNKSIDKYTKKIKDAEKNNKSNLKKQVETRKNISNQGLIVEEIISNLDEFINESEMSDEHKEANKELLKLHKKLEKLTKDYNDNLKLINKSIKKIENTEKNNKSNLKDQTKIKKQITKQGQLVEEIRNHLESMKLIGNSNG